MEILKQPELGQSILALRQKKKITQEELVELCNISVRTLQRIESGEVTPRDYTVRIILDALDYNIEQVEASIQNKTVVKRLQVAWIAGIIYFVFGIFETVVEYERFEAGLPYYFPLIYTGVKIISLVSLVFFMLGFFEIGKNYQSSLLKISAILMMGSFAVIELYDVVSIFSVMTSEEFLLIKGSEAVIFGGVDIIFGIALIRLGGGLGITPKLAGIFEIIVGALFISFVLAFLGVVMLIPATILEIIVLYKAYDVLQNSK
jgi:transcriptional regulator with XRE-family HTH domain